MRKMYFKSKLRNLKAVLLTVFAFGAFSGANAATIKVQEYLGFKWDDVETVEFGEVCMNAVTTFMKNGNHSTQKL